MDANFNQLCGRFDSVSMAPTSDFSADTTATLSKQQFDRYLGHAFLSVAQADNIVMPWEKGIFKQIFGEEQAQPSFEIPWFPRLEEVDATHDATVHELAAAVDRPSLTGGPIYLHAISCISDLDHDAQQSKLRSSACNKWLSILVICLHASDVGRNIAALGPLDDHRSEVEGHWRSNGSFISFVSFSLCKVCHGL